MCLFIHQNLFLRNLAWHNLQSNTSIKFFFTLKYFSPDSDETSFFYMHTYFKQWFEVKNILIMNLFITNTQLFTSQDINWWTGVVLIAYGLYGLSFWRHPFTAEDPLVSKWCNAKFFKICSDEQKNLKSTSWMSRFSAKFRFWMNYSFKPVYYHQQQHISFHLDELKKLSLISKFTPTLLNVLSAIIY